MAFSEGLETPWQTCCRLETEGNFNQLIIEALRYCKDPDFQFVATEVMACIARIIHSHGHLIAPENVERLAALPAALLRRSGLQAAMAAYRPAVSQTILGRLPFAVVSDTGQVRDLIVVSGRYGEMPKDRKSQLDRVGAATVAALGCRLSMPVLWNPQRYSFWVLDSLEREDVKVEGNSMDLPLALALYSIITSTPLPAGISASAEVRRDGTLKRVEAIGTKIETLKRERYPICRILVAADQDLPLALIDLACKVANLKKAFELVFPDDPVAGALNVVLDIASAEAAIQAQYDARLGDTCLTNADALIAYLNGAGRNEPVDARIPALFTALWRRGSCLSRRGDVNTALAALGEAVALYERYPKLIREENCAECRNSYAVLLKDVFHYEAAEALHRQNEKDLKRIGTLGHIRAKNLSSLSQLYLSWRRFKTAAEMQKKALAMIHERERERNYGYLAQIFARWGCFADAEKAMAEQERLLKYYDRESDNFCRWIQAEFLYRRGMAGTAANRAKDFANLHAFERQVLPAGNVIGHFTIALIVKFDGLARLRVGDEKGGLDRLEACIAYFDKTPEPMFPLIGAAVHAERALYHIEAGQIKEALPDIARVAEVLSRNWFVHFFGTQVQILRRLRLVGAEADATRSMTGALKFVRDAIPY